jgi:cleavage and polyadenylation specificity factor subunit 3
MLFAESSSKHTHSHSLPTRNLHANLSPTERLERLFMFLEAQFGAENLTPIAIPKVHTNQSHAVKAPSPSPVKAEEGADGSEDIGEAEERELEALQKQEIERLHKIGIPVPGVEIKVDKMVAKVWLEDLEVECANRVFGDRVRAVVERAVEVTAPLWA